MGKFCDEGVIDLIGTLVGRSEVCLNPIRSQVRDSGSMSAFKNVIPLQVTLLLLT